MKLIATLCILFISISLWGQEPFYNSLGVSQGLASNSTYTAFQDKQGYMWFGTDVGVSRYNGYEFTNFNTQDGLEGDEIYSIFQDSQERIWFLPLNGKISFYQDGTFYNASNTEFLREISSGKLFSSILETTDGDLYISASSGSIFKLSPDNQVTVIPVSGNVYNLWQDKKGEIRALSGNGINLIKDEGPELEKELNFLKYYPRSSYLDDTLFIGYGQGILTYKNTYNKQLEFPSLSEVTWLKAEQESFKIGTRNGLYDYNRETKKLNLIGHSGSTITSTYIDREGNLWVTTEEDGVFMSPSPSIRIYRNSNEILSSVTALSVDNQGNLWFGGDNGFFSNYQSKEIFRLPNSKYFSITAFHPTKNGGLYVLSKSTIGRFDQGEIKTINYLGNDILIQDETVYLGSNRAYVFDKRLLFKAFNTPALKKLELEEMMTRTPSLKESTGAICRTDEGEVYFGTRKGLFKMGDGSFLDLSSRHKSLSTNINDIVYDKEQQLLLIASSDAGVIILKNDKFIGRISVEKSGLSSSNIESLFLDSDENLWIGTVQGLDRIKTYNLSRKVTHFGSGIGLPELKILDIELLDKTLFLATEKGLISYDLNSSKFLPVPPQIYLNSISANGKSFDLLKNALSLDYDQNSLSIRVDGLSFKDGDKLLYYYKLEGVQDEWTPTTNRTIDYNALQPGAYSFMMKAVNSQGVESETLSFALTIHPPFWQTTWFRILVVALIVLVISFAWWIRIRSVRDKFELEKAFLLAEQKAGVLQMNPHFIFNSLNTIKGYYAQNKIAEANQFISKFSKLLRRILDSNTQFIPLEQEEDILELYLGLMQKRYDGIFDYSISNRVPANANVQIPPMMLQPLVENAVIHGVAPKREGNIDVTFKQEDDQLVCTVADDGVGFNSKSSSGHQSVGLTNIRERLHLLSRHLNKECTIEINSDNAKTVILIRIPLQINANDSSNN